MHAVHVESSGASTTGSPQTRSHTVRVVLADDSDVYRRGMRRAIEADERLSLVAEVADGAAAVAAIREHEPDVALLDLQMPELDGVEVCCEILADAPAHRTRFVLVSAFLSDEVIARARACGMDYELEKTTPRRQICDVLADAGGREPGQPGAPAGAA
ncbi:MAG TPA: response regulator transcription factor [Solirubrobacteraceae bacterium]|nr:response regulator transcription factor [Solirubrobacteraceae bacterium]